MSAKAVKRRIRMRRMLLQKFLGLLLIAMSVVFVCIAAAAPEATSDITPILFTAPMGIALLFSRKLYIF